MSFPLCLDSPLGLCFNLLLLRCPAAIVLEPYSRTASAKGDAGFAMSWSTSVVLLLCTCNMKTWEYAVIPSPVAIRITQQPPESTGIFKSSSSYRIYVYNSANNPLDNKELRATGEQNGWNENTECHFTWAFHESPDVLLKMCRKGIFFLSAVLPV